MKIGFIAYFSDSVKVLNCTPVYMTWKSGRSTLLRNFSPFSGRTEVAKSRLQSSRYHCRIKPICNLGTDDTVRPVLSAAATSENEMPTRPLLLRWIQLSAMQLERPCTTAPTTSVCICSNRQRLRVYRTSGTGCPVPQCRLGYIEGVGVPPTTVTKATSSLRPPVTLYKLTQ